MRAVSSVGNTSESAPSRSASNRVWRAIADSQEFGRWVLVKFDGPFVAGAQMRGQIVPTQVDPEVAKMQEPHKGTPFEIVSPAPDSWDVSAKGSGFGIVSFQISRGSDTAAIFGVASTPGTGGGVVGSVSSL